MNRDFDLEGVKEFCFYCKKDDCRTFHVITRQLELDVSNLTLDEIHEMEKCFIRDMRVDVFLNAGKGKIVMKVIKYGG